MLKPQDLYTLLKIHTLKGQDWSYASLSRSLFMSVSDVHAAVRRCHESRLLDLRHKIVRNEPLLEFLLHGVPYAYAAHRGGLTRGIVTSFAAPPLNELIDHQLAVPPVWSFAEGTVSGYEVTPLHKSAPQAALIDNEFYEVLALVDTLREGRARERQIAREQLEERIRRGQ